MTDKETAKYGKVMVFSEHVKIDVNDDNKFNLITEILLRAQKRLEKRMICEAAARFVKAHPKECAAIAEEMKYKPDPKLNYHPPYAVVPHTTIGGYKEEWHSMISEICDGDEELKHAILLICLVKSYESNPRDKRFGCAPDSPGGFIGQASSMFRVNGVDLDDINL